MAWSYIVSLRRSVLCSQITFWPRRARVRSRRTNNAGDIGSFRILIDLIFWQVLVRIEKLEFALFASMYARRSLSRIRCITFLIDFSVISHLSHFVGISSGPFTAKSHRYCVNEIAMWDKRSETFVGSMGHSTSRQCVAIALSPQRQYSGERYLLHGVPPTQS